MQVLLYLRKRKEMNKMNSLLLEMKMKERGKSQEYMANVLNMAPSTYYRKRIGESEFTRRELQVIRFELDLTAEEFDAIFFRDVLTQT
jgi:hypothetical protein